ncbi:DEAD/DEAH box helicase, partial [Patulibacter sp. S7RM1-6]
MALDVFTPQVAEWFTRAFDRPTPVQEQAWPLIAAGEHVLISAPTGSGKTIAAFLYGLDRLSAAPLPDDERRVRLLYVSPLKALSHDVDRNLRAPLRGIAAAAGADAAEIKVALRTGDTPQRDRAAMRRKPPDVLITTPESLFLMLTSGAREMLTGVETVIVDEIHAVAGTKRGSHLALTLERLSALRGTTGELRGTTGELRGSWAGDEVQRIGLSATQNPLEEVGRFLVGPGRQCRIVETGEKKRMDLRIQVPVESMTELDTTPAGAPKRPETDGIDDTTVPLADPDDPDASDDDFAPDGGANVAIGPDPLEPWDGNPTPPTTRNSIWPAMYPEILDLVEQHRSTIVFVNSRRSAERLALRLNELAEQRAEDQAREAGTDDPAGNPDARWDEDPDVARARRDGDLRRLIAGRDGVVPGDEAPEDDDDP